MSLLRTGDGDMSGNDEPGGGVVEQDLADLILHVAMALFAAKGFAATSTREIVEAAGVTKPMLYYYFGNKLGLCQAVLAHVQEVVDGTLEAALARTEDPERRLVEFLQSAFELNDRSPDLAPLMFRSLHGPEDEIAGLELRDLAQRVREAPRRVAHLTAQSGLIPAASERLFATMLQGVLYAWIVLPPDESGEELSGELAEQIVHRLLDGFRAS